ncbi:15-hydroxyprostaglandin dehydrogenase [NAD(+)]-like [Anoplophora glabripennis]|uniref:15-hydroxyprostaglandin dehydrogenase [NAD(+)]-like n=1 Tax=Anoplophora glabripennis TaxID=217634 RepID=UPI000873D862|nr:15-hydroxyprostaglandin dehydrogenase [NAD(+)]-like [Anoplophora glabripennis]
MVLQLQGKTALVTGGLSGIGLQFAKELLRCGVKGVTIADLNTSLVQAVFTEIEEEFGRNRVLFVKTDVTDMKQFENAFKKTVETFKNVDILINNAGIVSDKFFQKEIAVNINGVVNGIILGLDNYLPKYKEGSEAVIVNISSIAGLTVIPPIPIYSATKAAVIQMTRTWGAPSHYARTIVRVFAICPGPTATSLLSSFKDSTLGEGYDNWSDVNYEAVIQEPKNVAQEGIKLIQSCPNGTIWVVEEGKSAYQYVFPDKEKMQK